MAAAGGDTAWALTRWRHLVALHEAMDVLHQAMRPALHRPIHMAIKMPAFDVYFFVAINFVVGQNHKLKTMLWSQLINT